MKSNKKFIGFACEKSTFERVYRMAQKRDWSLAKAVRFIIETYFGKEKS